MVRRAQRIRVKLPALWRPVRAALAAADAGDVVAVEHAALDCRATEALLAFGLSVTGDVVFVTTRPERARYAIRLWLERSSSKTRSFSGRGVSGYRILGTTLWVCPAESTFDDVPFVSTPLLLVDGAHGILESPLHALGGRLNGRAIVAGQMAQRGTWFYSLARSIEAGDHAGELVQMPASAVLGEFPDEQSVAETIEEERRERLLELRDVEPKVIPFRVFARKRIHVRTDKEPELLSPQQRAEADAALGPNWHSRQLSPVVRMRMLPAQANYLATKRLAMRDGFTKFILVKYRRGGFTTLEQAISYYTVSEHSHVNVATLAHTDDSTRRIFRMVDLFHKKDPKALRAVGDSKTSLELSNGSLFFIGTAGSRGFARGDTLQRVHGSEASKWLRGRAHRNELMSDLLAGLLGAASYGEVVLESTPDGREDFYQLYIDAKARRNEFFPIFLRWFDDPSNRMPAGSFDSVEIEETLSDEERELVVRHELAPAEIAWRRWAKLKYGRLFPQECPEDDEKCFMTSGSMYFDVDVVLKLIDTIDDGEELKRHVAGGYEIRWEEPEKGVEYVMGVDTSEGKEGGDLSGIGVLRKDTGEQVASVHGLFSTRDLAEHIVRVSRQYNDALTGIERENHGHAVLQKVEDLGMRRSHREGGALYYHSQSSPKQGETLLQRGWTTNAKTRPMMLDELDDALTSGSLKVRDRLLLSEMLNFRLQSNGRWEADAGKHDDTIMKWAIAWQMRKHKKRKPLLL